MLLTKRYFYLFICCRGANNCQVVSPREACCPVVSYLNLKVANQRRGCLPRIGYMTEPMATIFICTVSTPILYRNSRFTGSTVHRLSYVTPRLQFIYSVVLACAYMHDRHSLSCRCADQRLIRLRTPSISRGAESCS